MIRAGALDKDPRVTCLTAERQTGGKGRLGRRFVSPEGGLYMSFALKSDDAGKARGMTAPLAAAVCHALEEKGVWDLGIKWVNDIYLRGKKICGILCEYAEGHLICGIGINVASPPGGFGPEAGPAGAIDQSGLTAEELAAPVLESCLHTLLESDPGDVRSFYERRLLYKGCKVLCETAGQLIRGTVLGIGPDYALRLLDESGRERRIDTGEIVRTRLEKKAAFFDFDGTLRRGDSIVHYLLFARRRGLIGLGPLLRAFGAAILYKLHIFSERRSKNAALRFLCRLSPEEKDLLNRDFAAELVRSVRPEGMETWRKHLKAGDECVLCSASTEQYMRLVGEKMGAGGVLCTGLAPDGRITENVKGKVKKSLILAWCRQNGADPARCCAYGDSLSDFDMLSSVGTATVINANGRVRRQAVKQGFHLTQWQD